MMRSVFLVLLPIVIVGWLSGGDTDVIKFVGVAIFSPDAASRIACDDGDDSHCTETTKINPTGETITKNENITNKQIPITSGKVAVYVNDKHTADIPIQSNGTARFSFGNYPVPLKGLSNVAVEYKYKDAAAFSLIAASEYAEEVKKHSKPCALAAAFEFIDNDGYKPNGAIDAGEKAFAKVLVKNSGKGTAYSVVLVGESSSDFIKLPGRTDAGDIPAGETKQVLIPLKGDVKTPAGSVKLKFYAEEERGYGSNTLIKQIETRALVPTGLEIVSHRILDGKAGFAKGNGNGIPENGETFELEIFVKNSGRGKANDVKITASIAEPGVNLERSNAVLGDIAPGRTVTAKLVVSLNRDLKTKVDPKSRCAIIDINKKISKKMKYVYMRHKNVHK